MRRAPLIECFLATILVLPAACRRPQSDQQESVHDPRKFTPDTIALVDARVQVIRDELVTLPDHPWSGEYYCGDGLGVNLRLLLAPAAGFVFTWNGCLGTYDRNYGAVTSDDAGRVLLHCEFPNDRRGFQGTATVFVPVRWGERQYLVAEDEMLDFCNAVNSGLARSAERPRFLLRYDPSGTPPRVDGDPRLPPQYQSLLRRAPIRGSVRSVGPRTTTRSAGGTEFHTTEITLDVGRAHGVFVGMELFVERPEVFDTVRVASVGEHFAVATITQICRPTPRPKTGWQVSSRFHNDDIAN